MHLICLCYHRPLRPSITVSHEHCIRLHGMLFQIDVDLLPNLGLSWHVDSGIPSNLLPVSWVL